MELTTLEISMLIFIVIVLIKIIHNVIKIEKIYKKVKLIVKENNEILN